MKLASPIQRALLSLLLWFSLAVPALAQQTGGTDNSSWVTSYALVILCVGLGLFVICRPSRREKKVRKD